MHRGIKVARNIIIIGLLIIIFLAMTGLRLTPIQAHKYSEKSMHYGPSEIIKIFDHGDYKHLLCKYDKWVSCNPVKRVGFLFWIPGDQPTIFENDKNEAGNYSRYFTQPVNIIYGIVNDADITKVELYLSEDKVLVQEGLYDDLFYFSWESDEPEVGMEKVIGYNSSGEKVCEITGP